MVQGGMEKEEAMRQFFEFIGEDIIVGQNVLFDYGFLKQWAVNHNMPLERNAAVSYTHLDVYKRQGILRSGRNSSGQLRECKSRKCTGK